MDNYYGIDKDNIEKYLNELAKEIKKQFESISDLENSNKPSDN
jgi:hypothetical protein